MKQKMSAINITYHSGISVVPNIVIKSVTGFRAHTALNSDCNKLYYSNLKLLLKKKFFTRPHGRHQNKY